MREKGPRLGPSLTYNFGKEDSRKIGGQQKGKTERSVGKMKSYKEENASQMEGVHETAFNVTGNTNSICLYISNMLFRIPMKSQMTYKWVKE